MACFSPQNLGRQVMQQIIILPTVLRMSGMLMLQWLWDLCLRTCSSSWNLLGWRWLRPCLQCLHLSQRVRKPLERRVFKATTGEVHPGCSVWILQNVHTVVIEPVLPCPKVMREKPHPKRLRNPLQQSPCLQFTSCQRTPLASSMSRLSLSPSPPSHPSPCLHS